jgi:hypothetical protein
MRRIPCVGTVWRGNPQRSWVECPHHEGQIIGHRVVVVVVLVSTDVSRIPSLDHYLIGGVGAQADSGDRSGVTRGGIGDQIELLAIGILSLCHRDGIDLPVLIQVHVIDGRVRIVDQLLQSVGIGRLTTPNEIRDRRQIQVLGVHDAGGGSGGSSSLLTAATWSVATED